MNPSDFVYDQIYRGSLNAGASQASAQKHAVIGTDEYKKGKTSGKKVSHLIERHIVEAKRVKK